MAEPQASSPQDLLSSLAYQTGGLGAIQQIQRSRYLAQALQSLQEGSARNISNKGALASNLLANALLMYGRNKNNAQLEQSIGQGMQQQVPAALAGTGLPGEAPAPSPGGPPALPSPPVGGLPTPSPQGPPVASPAVAPGGPPNANGPALAAAISGGAPAAQAMLGPATAAPAVTTPGSLTARLNNPGALRPLPNGQMWQGQTGVQGGFDVFDSPASGDRAGTLNLQNQQRLHGLSTLNEIIPKYAPSGDHNNPAAYIASVSRMTGFAPDQKLDLNDPATVQILKSAVYSVEGGGRQAPPAPQQPTGQIGGGPGASYQVASNGPTPGPPGQPQAGPINANTPPPVAQAMQAPQGPPTGLQATPGEIALYQRLSKFPVGSAMWNQGMQLAKNIQERAMTPLPAPKDMAWDGTKFAPLPGTQNTDAQGGATFFAQRDPFNKLNITANPDVAGPQAGQRLTGGNGGPVQAQTIPGGGIRPATPQDLAANHISPLDHSSYGVGPDGKLVMQSPAPVPVTELGQRQSDFVSSDAYKDYNQVLTSMRGLQNAIGAAGGPNNMVGATAITTLLQSWGITNPRGQGAAEQIEKNAGVPSQFASLLLKGAEGGMPMADMQNILSVVQSEAAAREQTLTQRLQADTASVHGRDPTLNGVPGEIIPPIPTMQPVGAPAARPGAPSRIDPQAAAMELQRRGYRLVNGQWTK
jgi:hypothetical protein